MADALRKVMTPEQMAQQRARPNDGAVQFIIVERPSG